MVNETDYDRFFAIGDIHGWADQLECLLEALDITSDDKILTLGDYVDRGPKSPEVLDICIELQNEELLLPLRGNHDQLMLSSRKDRSAYTCWVSFVDGKSTLENYGGQDEIPDQHYDFLESCYNFIETDNFIYVHGGLLKDKALQDHTPDELQWIRYWEIEPHFSDKVVICGHSSVGNTIHNDGYKVCLDTRMGVGPDGWLTALDMNSGNFVQVSRDFLVRTGYTRLH